jgi:polyprenyl-phospho-N-acetylgalactosaminyl synthase
MKEVPMDHPDTYVIIPVYNEETVVAGVVDAVRKVFSNVVCVDDGSMDNSVEAILATGAKLVQHPINLGAGAATQTGIDYALQEPAAEYFITFDADGQHDIKDAVRMLEYLKKHDLDIVFGSRFIGDVHNIGRVKRIFLKAAALFSRITSGVKLTDPHIGLRVLNRRFAENLKITLPDFTHASEVVHRVKEGNYKYDEVPITVMYSDYSKSKGQPMMNSINITIDLLFHRISKK